MTYLDAAAALDAEDLPAQAAWAYEAGLQREAAKVGDYLSLAVLYFVCMDAGYSAHHHLDTPFVAKAEERFFEVLNAAEVRFGIHPEVVFWRKYFRFLHYGEDGLDRLCRRLVERRESLVPYLYLYSFEDARRYQEQAHALLQKVERGTTARERYIRSVLTSHALKP